MYLFMYVFVHSFVAMCEVRTEQFLLHTLGVHGTVTVSAMCVCAWLLASCECCVRRMIHSM